MWSERIIDFNCSLELDNNTLPKNVKSLTPFRDNPDVVKIASQFYKKYYADNKKRYLILGINPGRLGAGATGIPFTDTKRLESICGIKTDFHLHEPSSVFVYDVINAYGGPDKFYTDYYISSVCPLGFVKKNDKGTWVNYNYYDDKELQDAVEQFMIEKLNEQLEFGVYMDKVFCLGTGKNFKYFNALNKRLKLFQEVVPLEHPRYVMQYKLKKKEEYIDKFIRLLS